MAAIAGASTPSAPSLYRQRQDLALEGHHRRAGHRPILASDERRGRPRQGHQGRGAARQRGAGVERRPSRGDHRPPLEQCGRPRVDGSAGDHLQGRRSGHGLRPGSASLGKKSPSFVAGSEATFGGVRGSGAPSSASSSRCRSRCPRRRDGKPPTHASSRPPRSSREEADHTHCAQRAPGGGGRRRDVGARGAGKCPSASPATPAPQPAAPSDPSKDDKNAPVIVDADSLDSFQKQGLAIFKGNVIARQNNSVQYADQDGGVHRLQDGPGGARGVHGQYPHHHARLPHGHRRARRVL